MSVLSDFIISSGAEVPEYDGIKDFPDDDRCRFNRITPLEAAGLLKALRGEGDQIAMISEFPLLTPEDAESWIMGVPEDFVSSLGGLNSGGITSIADSFSQITAEELGWTAADTTSVVTELAALSKRAMEDEKRMYLWNAL